MSRCAVFVDLGYVRAALRLLDSSRAAGQNWRIDYTGLSDGIATFVELDCSLPLLRSYWYDAAPARAEFALVRRFASRQRVKIRIGPMTDAGQKEVDIQLHDDLTILAAGGLVPILYLLSGDGDFRPTITRAQALGAELVVLDIVGSPASHLLAAEADRHVTLPSDFFRPYLDGALAPTAASVDTPSPSDPYEQMAFQAGCDFAREWLVTTDGGAASGLLRQSNWRLPPRLDAKLLSSADSTIGLMREQPQLRRLVRAGFWRELSARLSPTTPADG